MKILLSILLLSLAIKAQASANTYIGHVSVLQDAIYLKTGVNTQYRLLTYTAQIKRDLERLTTGDLISVIANKLNRTENLYVQNINFVGLNQVLGTWSSEDGYIFDFLAYDKLKLFSLRTPDNKIRWKDFHYSISPSSGEDWAIFLVNNRDIHVGYIKVTDRQMTLEIIDPDTGNTEDNFDLHKIEQNYHGQQPTP